MRIEELLSYETLEDMFNLYQLRGLNTNGIVKMMLWKLGHEKKQSIQVDEKSKDS